MAESLTVADPERTVEFEFVRATENAALNAMHWIGRGDKEAADAAACDAIYGVFDLVDIRGEVVIGEEEVNLIGEVALQFRGAIQGLPTVFAAFGVEVVAVNQFVQNEMAMGIAAEFDCFHELIEIAAMIMNVAGHPDFAFGGKMHDLLLTKGRALVFFHRGLEGFDDAVGGGDRHSAEL